MVWKPFLLWVCVCLFFTDVAPSTWFIVIFRHLTHYIRYFGCKSLIFLAQTLYGPLYGLSLFLYSLSVFQIIINWLTCFSWAFEKSGGSCNIRRFFLLPWSPVWRLGSLLLDFRNSFLIAFLILSVTIRLDEGSDTFIRVRLKKWYDLYRH